MRERGQGYLGLWIATEHDGFWPAAIDSRAVDTGLQVGDYGRCRTSLFFSQPRPVTLHGLGVGEHIADGGDAAFDSGVHYGAKVLRRGISGGGVVEQMFTVSVHVGFDQAWDEGLPSAIDGFAGDCGGGRAGRHFGDEAGGGVEGDAGFVVNGLAIK